jgi:5-methylcytosine-specific restriction endonuclease McrA
VDERIAILLASLGIDSDSFARFLEWSLCEHLVRVMSDEVEMNELLVKPDALKRFRVALEARTGRRWSQDDYVALFERVKSEQARHIRTAIPYEEQMKLLARDELRCKRCGAEPPQVKLHIDHVIPVSRGGSNKSENLQFLCATCNLRKSNQMEVSGPWLNLS